METYKELNILVAKKVTHKNCGNLRAETLKCMLILRHLPPALLASYILSVFFYTVKYIQIGD